MTFYEVNKTTLYMIKEYIRCDYRQGMTPDTFTVTIEDYTCVVHDAMQTSIYQGENCVVLHNKNFAFCQIG